MNKLKPQLFHPPKPPPSPPPAASYAASAATKSFNSKISRLSLEGAHHQVLRTYISMLKSNIPTDPFTYPSLIKACTSLSLFSVGVSFHQRLIVNGFSSDSYIASSLITFYSKHGHVQRAQKMFDMMPIRNIVPWTAIIGCYARAGDVNYAFVMHNRMLSEGVPPASVTILAILSGVMEGAHVECLHSCVVKHGFGCNVVLINCMLSVYAKCGRLEAARCLFESVEERDLVSWNSMISAYSSVGNVKEICRLLFRMKVTGVQPDQQTFTSVLPAIAKEGDVRLGKLVHGHMVISGCESSAHVQTSLVSMYLKFGNVNLALRIFERTRNKDAVEWAAMISGLLQNEQADKALEVFQQMLLSGVMPSSITIASALAACAQLGALKLGLSIHGYIVRKRVAVDVVSHNALITMYAKCGCLDQSFVVFQMMDERDVVSWNAIVSSEAQNGHVNEALYFFNQMRVARKQPDSVTVVTILQACASIGAYHQGKCIHNFIVRSCLGPCIMIDTALVDMYFKCGNLDLARKCFDRMPYHDLISWSTIIAGYGSHGKGETALDMYSQFLRDGFEPNPTICLAILYACSHSGLVDKGLDLFECMVNDFRIEPELEHCGCVIDLLCRAGRIEDAYEFYKRMFTEPVADVLGILLDACRAKRKAELAEVIAKEISLLNPADPGKYVQLARSSASTANWVGVSEAWGQMRSLGLKKTPGWSFIELNGTITTFFRGHVCHPHHEETMLVLNNLYNEIRELVWTSILEDGMMDAEVPYY